MLLGRGNVVTDDNIGFGMIRAYLTVINIVQ